MFKKIKNLVQENRNRHIVTQKRLDEIIWANVYHDSIKGIPELNDLNLNIGRFAGNYSFFYLLNRILNDYKPNKILEFGLGESSKFVFNMIVKNQIHVNQYHIYEQDDNWLSDFLKKNDRPKNADIFCLPIIEKKIFGFPVKMYDGFDKKNISKFDFYLIDGPNGSEHYSRYDLVYAIDSLEKNDEFIILLDDYNRPGEVETANVVVQLLNKKNITFKTKIYKGLKDQLIIATSKYYNILSV